MPAKFERCVKHVREQGGKANPYAVCHASLDKEFTKEDKDKLGQILKELKEVGDMIKGGEGSGIKGHKTPQERFNLANKYTKRNILRRKFPERETETAHYND